jgi:hypothetical protein
MEIEITDINSVRHAASAMNSTSFKAKLLKKLIWLSIQDLLLIPK